MSKGCIIAAVIGAVIVGVLLIGFFIYQSTYNTIITMDENVKAKFGNVQAQYQRRMDLIPNLVEVVKGYAAHERGTLEAVVQARAQATQTKLDINSAESLAKFQAAQGNMMQALSRLMVVVENYPDLKANQNFLDLQAQLEGTENRIKQARYDYNEAVQGYNSYTRKFFVNLFFGGQFPAKPYFEAEAGADQAPKVKF
jgi:LemA protein